MEAHAHYDDLHPTEALELIKCQATTPELQQRVRHAARRSLEYLSLALDACYVAYSAVATRLVSLLGRAAAFVLCSCRPLALDHRTIDI